MREHTKNLMEHTSSWNFVSTVLFNFRYISFIPVPQAHEIKQNYVSRYYGSLSISKYGDSEVQTHISVKQRSTKSQHKNNMKIR